MVSGSSGLDVASRPCELRACSPAWGAVLCTNWRVAPWLGIHRSLGIRCNPDVHVERCSILHSRHTQECNVYVALFDLHVDLGISLNES